MKKEKRIVNRIAGHLNSSTKLIIQVEGLMGRPKAIGGGE
jgi:hypothetical protein